VTRLLDIPGLAEHGVGFKTVAEALYLRDHVLDRLEIANSTTDRVRRRAALTFVVVGAGYAGTELTAQMARLTTNLLPFYPALAPDDIRWILVDMASAVMPELGEHLGTYALGVLRRRNVEVRLGVSVSEATASEVTFTDGTSVDCTTLVWCAGVTPNPLIGQLGLPTTKGRLDVDLTLSVAGHPEVYAIGDAAAVPDSTKGSDLDSHVVLCPPTAQHAIRQASAVARNIAASLGRGTSRPYHHGDLGLVVDLGGHDAAATPLHLHLRGRLAKIATRGYHLYVLPTSRRRVRVAFDWALSGKHADDVSFGLLSRDVGLAQSEPTDRSRALSPPETAVSEPVAPLGQWQLQSRVPPEDHSPDRVHRVELQALASNSRAINCYLACGFRREGVRREAELYPDGWKDFIMMGILRSEHAAQAGIPGRADSARSPTA
jgi:NADH dehydrogenase